MRGTEKKKRAGHHQGRADGLPVTIGLGQVPVTADSRRSIRGAKRKVLAWLDNPLGFRLSRST